MELWDAYHRDGTKAGVDLVRYEPIPDGLYHVVSEIIVRHTGGEYLVMQRDFNKKGWPGAYECTAGGSALKGEGAYECAVRELFEETGIKETDLKYLGEEIVDRHHTIYHEYFCETSAPYGSVVLQEGETISYKWVTPGELREMIENGTVISARRNRYVLELME